MNDPEVILASCKLTESKEYLHSLQQKKVEAEREKGEIAVKRIKLNEIRQDAFDNPRSKKGLEIKLIWMNVITTISNLKVQLKDQDVIILNL